MPLQATSGAASYDAFGGGVPVAANYIEDVFSTWLYTGNGSTQTINNGIDLAGKGGLVWIKNRDTAGYVHRLFDSARGNNSLTTSSTAAQVDFTGIWGGLTSTGFSIAATQATLNESNKTYASWTFREQPKFFDVVTFTVASSANQTISHALASTPGAIIFKSITSVSDWRVYHRSLGLSQQVTLNSTSAASSTSAFVDVNDTTFTIQGGAFAVGQTYVAYLFAHNAGGFGLSGTDNVISCGSFTTDGSGNATVNLGYEPQWVMTKASSTASNWFMNDNMRGMSVIDSQMLRANSSAAEDTFSPAWVAPNATGFNLGGGSASQTYIYIAIRRGPMRTPTTGTSVFTPFYFAGDSSTSRQLSSGFPADTFLGKRAIGDVSPFVDRLRGKDLLLYTPSTSAEATSSLYCRFDSNLGPIVGWNAAAGVNINGTSWDYRAYAYRRAPSFHDVVCYTGTGTGNPRALNHNLTVVPELIIVKRRSDVQNWYVYGNALGANNYLELNTNRVLNPDGPAGTFTPATSTTFCPEDGLGLNNASPTYVAYLFASCPGVSKVGSYTGTGTTQVINCGFTGGARFVLIKRTSGVGDWYVWDSARGIVSGNDPYFLLNSSSGEITNTDFVDTAATGFEISSTAPAAINASGGTFIFLAIA